MAEQDEPLNAEALPCRRLIVAVTDRSLLVPQTVRRWTCLMSLAFCLAGPAWADARLDARRSKPMDAPRVTDCEATAGDLTDCERPPSVLGAISISPPSAGVPPAPDRPTARVLSWKPWAIAAGAVLAAALISGAASSGLFDQARTQRFASDAANTLELSHGAAVAADIGFGLGGALGLFALILLAAGAPQ